MTIAPTVKFSMAFTISLVAVVCIICLAIWKHLRKNKLSKLPPGPPGLPIIGNILDMPSKMLFLKLDEWKNQYGEIVYYNLAGTKVVVLNSVKAATDILEKQSGVTSGRMRMVMASEIMGGDLFPLFIEYGTRWRRTRRASRQVFNANACQVFWPMQEHESEVLIRDLHADQSRLEDHLSRLTASVTWRLLYGGPPIGDPNDERVKLLQDFSAGMARAGELGTFIVDVFPFLKPLPTWMAGWKKQGVKFFEDNDAYFRRLFREGAKYKEEVSFVNYSLKIAERFGISHQELAWVTGAHFSAGEETTATVLFYFVQAMLLYPETCKKGQEEIDRVCGNRIPRFSDSDQLPYVGAMVKEVVRWRTPAPAGIPHAATQDFVYQSYVIPKGTVIVDNVWSISHDPSVFPNSDTYDPSRYLTSSGELRTSSDPADQVYVFGHGRWICPGKDIAMNSLFIDIAALLWAFDFARPVGSDGKECVPGNMDFVDKGLVVRPAPFGFNLKPRRDNLDDLLAQF
ncbi:cytochrome P450 [Dacryopinax primogenitus]|uniref:Cytochrome P450 n=1 Tax=Dacryopinax primogenitus (strain DJM 731) TaxID=1858805 RepID=M5G676_DACPD|nr:cytochrome P450 [Dacryopinax primogenitus]EJU01337.1 cytochrome P450 [Dacryopinax primogenitus]